MTDERNENMPTLLVYFLLETTLGLEHTRKLINATYGEFDRRTPDEEGSKTTIDPIELVELSAFLELLENALQVLADKSHRMFARFRNSLVAAGVETAELEAMTNRKRQEWRDDEAERLKQITAKRSERDLEVHTQITRTFTDLYKLHQILKSAQNDYRPFGRISRLALQLVREIDKVMEDLDGGTAWSILRPPLPR
jgi:hypothetical protein